MSQSFKNIRLRNKLTITPWLFLLPGLLFFAFYVLLPIMQSFNISFYKWDGMGVPEYVGIQNYQKLIKDRAFEISLWNNLKWLILYLLAIPAGLAMALFLNQNVAGIRLYKSLFFFPFVISQVVVGLVFTWFYDPRFGLFNQLLTLIGLEPISVLGDPAHCYLWHYYCWSVAADCLLYDSISTGLNALDPEQVEAARIDGEKAIGCCGM